MKKCKYCGKKLNDNFEFCNSKCENCYEKMMDKNSHKIKYFTLGIILGFLVMFYGIISNNNVFIIGIGIIVMGIDVVLLPFTTPETIYFLGYQKSKFAGNQVILYFRWRKCNFFVIIIKVNNLHKIYLNKGVWNGV